MLCRIADFALQMLLQSPSSSETRTSWIHQTSLDLLKLGYEVQIVSDAVSSRAKENKEVGLRKIASEGGKITSVEKALFELLHEAGSEEFKAISKLVK